MKNKLLIFILLLLVFTFLILSNAFIPEYRFECNPEQVTSPSAMPRGLYDDL